MFLYLIQRVWLVTASRSPQREPQAQLGGSDWGGQRPLALTLLPHPFSYLHPQAAGCPQLPLGARVSPALKQGSPFPKPDSWTFSQTEVPILHLLVAHHGHPLRAAPPLPVGEGQQGPRKKVPGTQPTGWNSRITQHLQRQRMDPSFTNNRGGPLGSTVGMGHQKSDFPTHTPARGWSGDGGRVGRAWTEEGQGAGAPAQGLAPTGESGGSPRHKRLRAGGPPRRPGPFGRRVGKHPQGRAVARTPAPPSTPRTWPSPSRARPSAGQGSPGPGLEAARRPETPGPVPMAAGGSGGLRRPPDKARGSASCHCAAAPAPGRARRDPGAPARLGHPGAAPLRPQPRPRRKGWGLGRPRRTCSGPRGAPRTRAPGPGPRRLRSPDPPPNPAGAPLRPALHPTPNADVWGPKAPPFSPGDPASEPQLRDPFSLSQGSPPKAGGRRGWGAERGHLSLL